LPSSNGLGLCARAGETGVAFICAFEMPAAFGV